MFSEGIEMEPWGEIGQYYLKADSAYSRVFGMRFYSSVLLCIYFVHLLFSRLQVYCLFVIQLRVSVVDFGKDSANIDACGIIFLLLRSLVNKRSLKSSIFKDCFIFACDIYNTDFNRLAIYILLRFVKNKIYVLLILGIKITSLAVSMMKGF